MYGYKKWENQIQIKQGYLKNSEYQIYRNVKKGTKVFIGWKINQNIPVAIKQLHQSEAQKLKYIEGEIIALQVLHHPNIENQVIMEYCPRGNLKVHLKDQKLTSLQIWQIVNDINNVLIYLKSQKYFHRDLKPQNILFTKDGTIKIYDFGRSKQKEETEIAKTSKVGTPTYSAPQVFLQQYKNNEEIQYSYSCEMWSLGAILYELLTNFPLFKTNKINNLRDEWEKQKKEGLKKIQENIQSKTWLQVLRLMLNFNPSERITSEDLKIKLESMKYKTLNKPNEIKKYLDYRYQKACIWKKIAQQLLQQKQKNDFKLLAKLAWNCYILSMKNIKEEIDNNEIYIGDEKQRIKDVDKQNEKVSQLIEKLTQQRDHYKKINKIDCVKMYRHQVKKMILNKVKIKRDLYHLILIAYCQNQWFPINPKRLYNNIKAIICRSSDNQIEKKISANIKEFNISQMEHKMI